MDFLTNQDLRDVSYRLVCKNENHTKSGIRKAEASQAPSASDASGLFEFCPMGMAVLRMTDGKFVEANQAFLSIFELSWDELIGHTPVQLGLWNDPDQLMELMQDLLKSGAVSNYGAKLRDRQGNCHDFSIYGRRMAFNGEALALLILFDITVQMSAQEELSRLAFYDDLTRLPNRRLLRERLNQAIVVSDRTRHHGALLFIDLDDFKRLNDQQGHQAGDALLYQAGKRLQMCVREQDTVARLGGDEFVILLLDLNASADLARLEAEVIANKVIQHLNRTYTIDGISCHSFPSIGITLFCGRPDSVDDVMRRADKAMYQAKASGKNRMVFYASSAPIQSMGSMQ